MGKKFFTADWHNGEEQRPDTHSFLRQYPTEVMVERWLRNVEERIRSVDDELIFVGDLGITLHDTRNLLLRLPQCRVTVVRGDKEYASKYFSVDEFDAMMHEEFPWILVCQNVQIQVGEHLYFVSHKPTDCFVQDMPAICGHIHGTWRTQKMNRGQPIINVGIDSWNQIVSEEFITHQYNAITKGYYDENCFVNLFDREKQGKIAS